jgi:hypothetical protein
MDSFCFSLVVIAINPIRLEFVSMRGSELARGREPSRLACIRDTESRMHRWISVIICLHNCCGNVFRDSRAADNTKGGPPAIIAAPGRNCEVGRTPGDGARA